MKGNLEITQKSAEVVCIYHANCIDGFTAAWITYKHFEEKETFVDLVPAEYNKELNLGSLVLDKSTIIYIVDFSVPPEVLISLAEQVHSIVTLDHHISAIRKYDNVELPPNVKMYFDTSKSGALLTWEHFADDGYIPEWIKAVAARDLWDFRDAKTEPIAEYVLSVPKTIEAYDKLSDWSLHELLALGEAAIQVRDAHVAEAISRVYLNTNLRAGSIIPITNCSPIIASEVGNQLCKSYPFSVTYFITSKGDFQYSLRSGKGSGIDVSIFAELYNGGGHKNAAGFVSNKAPNELNFNSLY